MCKVPPQTCPQDGGLAAGDINSVCFVVGAQSPDKKMSFKGPQDFANPELMKKVFNVSTGSSEGCGQFYNMVLPGSVQEAVNVASACTVRGQQGQLPGWYLINRCVGNNPSGTILLNTQCCNGVNDVSKCPKGYCPANNNCIETMTTYCINNGSDDPQCALYFKNSNNDLAKKQVVNNLIRYYTSNPYSNDLTKNPFANNIYNLCRNAPPGTCDSFLYKACNPYTRDQLNNNQTLLNLCGCHLNPTQYNKYKDLKVFGGLFQSQCDPLCSNIDTIQQGNDCNDVKCSQNVCIIDFSTDNVKKLVQEGLNLNQDCIGVPGQGNTCIVSLNIEQANEVIEKNIKVSQKCGSCKLVDLDNTSMTPVDLDCNDLTSGIKNYFDKKPQPPKKNNLLLYILIGTVGILILLIIAIGLYKLLQKRK